LNTIDVRPVTKEQGDEVKLGIFALEGDRLTVCLAGSKERPASFEPKDTPGRRLYRLRKVSDAGAEAKAAEGKKRKMDEHGPEWGAVVEGLRCRWLPAAGPVRVGKHATVRLEVENTGDVPLFYHCSGKNTWHMRLTNASDDWLRPDFNVTTAEGSRA